MISFSDPNAVGFRCKGGDDCCDGQCGHMEGDCDSNSDCLPGHECGDNNCPDVKTFETDDDCCVGKILVGILT